MLDLFSISILGSICCLLLGSLVIPMRIPCKFRIQKLWTKLTSWRKKKQTDDTLCWICCDEDSNMEVITGTICQCRGTHRRGLHMECLLRWLDSVEGERAGKCPVCNSNFDVYYMRQSYFTQQNSEALGCVMILSSLLLINCFFLMINFQGEQRQFLLINQDANVTVNNLIFQAKYVIPDCQHNRFCEEDLINVIHERQWNRQLYSVFLNLTLIGQPTWERKLQVLRTYKLIYKCCGIFQNINNTFLESELHKLEQKWNGYILPTKGKLCLHRGELKQWTWELKSLIEKAMYKNNYCMQTIALWDCICVDIFN